MTHIIKLQKPYCDDDGKERVMVDLAIYGIAIGVWLLAFIEALRALMYWLNEMN